MKSLSPDGSYAASDATGILVSRGDDQALARALEFLLVEEALRSKLGVNARRDARLRFELGRQVDSYINWFNKEILADVSEGRTTIIRHLFAEVPLFSRKASSRVFSGESIGVGRRNMYVLMNASVIAFRPALTAHLVIERFGQ